MTDRLIEKYLGEVTGRRATPEEEQRAMAVMSGKIGEGASYKTLNQAAPYYEGLASGKTEIWYMKPEQFRNLSMGLDFLKKYQGREDMEMPQVPTTKTLKNTHILLGKIKETDKENIFRMMQGENWSPFGEARNLIRSKGLKHTSMSVGDVVKIGSSAFMVDTYGFKKL